MAEKRKEASQPALSATYYPDIFYAGLADIEKLLGSQGQDVLGRVLKLIEGAALEHGWPLWRIEVRHTRDPEVKDWEYVLLVLTFECPFDAADRHLHELYGLLDSLADRLGKDERLILGRLFFYDIETTSVV